MCLVVVGARVAFVQRSDASGFVEEMREKHGTAPLFLPCDITDTERLRQCIQDAGNAHGDITVLVNNAANDKRHETLDTDESFWDWSTAINLKAYFFTSQAVIPGMQAKGFGSIINFSSISYMMGNAGYPIYATSNAGITGMTRALAREFGPDKIRVNAIAPGWVLTDKQKELWVTEEALENQLNRQCLKETLSEEDIVGATLFLVSHSSRMMTGQLMAVDGGVVHTG